MAKQVNEVVTVYKSKDSGVTKAPQALQKSLKDSAKAIGIFDKAVKGAVKTVKLQDEAFTVVTGKIKKLSNANENLSITGVKITENLKAQRRASEALAKAQAKLIATTQKQIARERAAQIVRQKSLAQMAMMSELSRARRTGRQDFNNQIRLENDKAKAIERSQNAVRRASRTNKEFASATQTAVQKAILSWKSFERVILVHVIRRAFHMLMTTIRQAVTRIQEFHTAVVEIRTISQTMPGSLNQWAVSLQKVSDAWGIDLIDAANARYQILSNQIAKGVKQTEMFSDETFKFAKVTKSTAEEAVNVLTAALNAYGMTAEDVTKVSAILFKLVEFGRVRITEIADTLGRASVPAAQLGISLEELAATIANITIKGIKATESMTLIRGIVMKLNKPTKEMKELFSKLGVSSGEALIAIHGLAGTLKILQEETKGSSSEIAQLFGRIRPTMGISALLSDLEGFNDVLAEFGDKATLDYMNALNDQFQTSGERVKLAFNQVKNFVQIGLGRAAADTILKFTDKFKTIEVGADGVERKISGLVNIIKALVKWGTALGIVLGGKFLLGAVAKLSIALKFLIMDLGQAGNRAAFLRLNLRNVARSVGLLGINFTSFGVILAATFAVNKIIMWRREIKQANADLKQMVTDSNRSSALAGLQSQVSAGTRSFRQNTSGGARNLSIGLGDSRVVRLAAEAADLEEILKALEKRQKEAVVNFKEHAKIVSSTLVDMYKSLRDEIKDATKEITKSFQEAQKFSRTIEDTIFAVRQRARTPVQQLAGLQGREAQLLREFENAKGIDATRIARDRYKEAILATEAALYGMANATVKAANAEDKAFNRRGKDVFSARNKGRTDRFGVAIAKSFRGRGGSSTVSQAVKDAIAGETERKLITLGKAGLKVEQDFAAHQAAIVATAEKAITRLQAIRKKIMLEAAEIGGAVTEVITAAFKGINLGQADIEIEKLTKKLKESGTLPGGFLDSMHKAGIDLNLISIETERTRSGLEAWATHLAEVKKTMEGILDLQRKHASEVSKARKAISDADSDQLDAVAKMQKAFGVLGKVGGITNKHTTGEDFEKIGDFIEILSNPKLSTGQAATTIDSMSKSIRDMMSAISQDTNKRGLKGFGALLGFDIDARSEKVKETLVQLIRQMGEINTAISDKSKAQSTLQGISDIVGGMQDIQIHSAAASQALIDAANAGFSNYNKFNILLQGVIVNLKAIQGITGGTEAALSRAQGGSIHAAMGQFISQGTDTVPAMLTPGEFVMNRSSTAKFLQQLVPMNYGQQNANHTQQGNNVQFGDINVTVGGGNTTQQTAVDIGNALRREIRRGRVGL